MWMNRRSILGLSELSERVFKSNFREWKFWKKFRESSLLKKPPNVARSAETFLTKVFTIEVVGFSLSFISYTQIRFKICDSQVF